MGYSSAFEPGSGLVSPGNGSDEAKPHCLCELAASFVPMIYRRMVVSAVAAATPDGFAMVYKLVSAPEEHQQLIDELLVPAVLEFMVDSLYG